MTPKIITHSDQLKKILLANHKIVFELDQAEAISIKQTRNLNQQISFSNTSSSTIDTFVIHQAHNLTLAAQNNLLKTLEETPSNKQIILITPTPQSLLPTILSRCQLIKANKKPPTPAKNFTPPLKSWKLAPGQVPNLTDQILKQGNPGEYLNMALQVIKPTSPPRTQILKQLHNCILDLKSNINPRLSLDRFFISINS